MSNIATILKSEISRVARKEVRGETQVLKKAVTSYRSEIASLKRRVHELEQQVRRLGKGAAKVTSTSSEDESATSLRFSATGLAKQRQRLGLSAQTFGALVGVSGLSVYKWEQGVARPRAKYLPAIAAVRTMGKREAAARLQAMAK